MKKLSSILLVLLVAVMGCKLPGSLTGSSKGSTGGSDPRADVVAASKKFIELPFLTANMEGQGTTEIKSQVQYAAPDRYHVKYLGGTGAGMELIWIGNDSYRNTNGTW